MNAKWLTIKIRKLLFTFEIATFVTRSLHSPDLRVSLKNHLIPLHSTFLLLRTILLFQKNFFGLGKQEFDAKPFSANSIWAQFSRKNSINHRQDRQDLSFQSDGRNKTA